MPILTGYNLCWTNLVLFFFKQKDAEIQALRIQCNELTIKCNDLNGKLEDFGNDKKRLEQANHLLDESVKVAQGKFKISLL